MIPAHHYHDENVAFRPKSRRVKKRLCATKTLFSEEYNAIFKHLGEGLEKWRFSKVMG